MHNGCTDLDAFFNHKTKSDKLDDGICITRAVISPHQRENSLLVKKCEESHVAGKKPKLTQSNNCTDLVTKMKKAFQ